MKIDLTDYCNREIPEPREKKLRFVYLAYFAVEKIRA
jgi:hypothetical protein